MAGTTLDLIDSSGKVVRLPVAAQIGEPPYKMASHPYPVLIDEDAYSPKIKPLDFTLKEIPIYTEAYSPTIKPLDFTLRSILRSRCIDNGEVYIPSIKPLDFTLKWDAPRELKVFIDDSEAYTPSVAPLDFTLKEVLIEYNHPNNDAYTPSIKPLDFSLIEV